MKKASKLLAVILAGIMLFSIFTVSASAKAMTKSEVVKFYHSILKETAEKNKIILIKCDSKEKDSADFSGLSGLDLKLTKKQYSYCNGLWREESDSVYHYGVSDEFEEAVYTGIYYAFSLEWALDWGYNINTATYSDDKIVIELEDDQEFHDIIKLTVYLKNNVISKITKEVFEEYYDSYSVIKDIPFEVTYEGNYTYTFKYDKIPAKSLTLSETNITLGYGDVAELSYTVGPENATFKDVEPYAVFDENETLIAYAYIEDGKLYVEACNEGTGILEVYTMSGDVCETCEVTVEYTFFDRIRSIFDNILFWFEVLFGI